MSQIKTETFLLNVVASNKYSMKVFLFIDSNLIDFEADLQIGKNIRLNLATLILGQSILDDML